MKIPSMQLDHAWRIMTAWRQSEFCHVLSCSVAANRPRYIPKLPSGRCLHFSARWQLKRQQRAVPLMRQGHARPIDKMAILYVLWIWEICFARSSVSSVRKCAFSRLVEAVTAIPGCEEQLFRSFEEVCAVLLQAMAPVMQVTYEPRREFQKRQSSSKLNYHKNPKDA